MKIQINIVFILIFLALHLKALCQNDTYSLLTERYVDRPVTMHRGQLQINSGYEFSSLNKIYDFEGNSLDLNDEGIASEQHLFPIAVKYGILEWFQIGASMNYARKGLRTQNFIYISNAGIISHSEIENWKGFDDLYLGIDFTAPFLTDFMNWVVSGGIQLPVFNHEPDQPTHTIDFFNYYSDSTVIRYYYNNKFGNGIPMVKIGTSLKIRFSKLALESSFDMKKGLSQGESIYWQSRYSNGVIDYREIPYQYDPGLTFDYQAAIAYQALDWLAVMFSYDGMYASGGWTTESGKKVGTGKISINSLGVGYEIQISPHLRLNQFIDVPFAGTNIMAYWIFQTGISMNFMTTGK